MSRFFPHTQYAEDQPLAHTILTTHVLYRGFQTGAVVGIATGSTTYLYALSRSTFQARAASKAGQIVSPTNRVLIPAFSKTILRHTSAGAIYGVGALVVGLAWRMKGREEIEWQDRAWRLMENQGQLEVDDASLGGSALGAVSSFLSRGNIGWRQVVGRTAIGNVAGIVSYMIFQYGIFKGKRLEHSVESTTKPVDPVS